MSGSSSVSGAPAVHRGTAISPSSTTSRWEKATSPGPPGVAAIYGMSVKPEARGRGIAGGLTTILLRRAKEAGSRRAVLHSTEMAVGIYRRSGFVERCRFTAFATAQLWSHGG